MNVEYGGFVYTVDNTCFDEISRQNLYTCVRAIRPENKSLVEAPLARQVMEFGNSLTQVGWDVVHGNGWVSAACDGLYPIDVFASEDTLVVSSILNNFGLFESEEDALRSCAMNNSQVPALAPWYAVAVFVDTASTTRLEASRLKSYQALESGSA